LLELPTKPHTSNIADISKVETCSAFNIYWQSLNTSRHCYAKMTLSLKIMKGNQYFGGSPLSSSAGMLPTT